MTPIEIKLSIPTALSLSEIAHDLNGSDLLSGTNLFDQITDIEDRGDRPMILTLRIEPNPYQP